MNGRPAIVACCALLVWGLGGCGGKVKSDRDGTADGDTDVSESDSTSPDVTGDADDDGWYSDECRVTSCQTHVYQCGDCEDNDGDGVIDSRDTDCLGPCDNNESGFNTGIPGGGSNPCSLDCYFDQDSGAGNDDCHWDHRCDPYEPLELNPCNYSIPCSTCTTYEPGCTSAKKASGATGRGRRARRGTGRAHPNTSASVSRWRDGSAEAGSASPAPCRIQPSASVPCSRVKLRGGGGSVISVTGVAVTARSSRSSEMRCAWRLTTTTRCPASRIAWQPSSTRLSWPP